ncbi:MAG: OadG family protein [Clostridia bacterium]|nr:OadG family protein [Clostridia bacterium]
MTKKKIIKISIICIVFLALLAGLIALMVLPQNYGTPDKLGVGSSNFGQRLWIGVQVALLGLGTVFVMLVLLIFMVTLMRLIFEGVGKLKEKQSAKKANSLSNQQTVAAVEEIASEEDEEVVAVIMAALNAYYETQQITYKSNLKFRVRSIKEI